MAERRVLYQYDRLDPLKLCVTIADNEGCSISSASPTWRVFSGLSWYCDLSYSFSWMTYINSRARLVTDKETASQFLEPETLVFTHNNINMQNVILERDRGVSRHN